MLSKEFPVSPVPSPEAGLFWASREIMVFLAMYLLISSSTYLTAFLSCSSYLCMDIWLVKSSPIRSRVSETGDASEASSSTSSLI